MHGVEADGGGCGEEGDFFVGLSGGEDCGGIGDIDVCGGCGRSGRESWGWSGSDGGRGSGFRYRCRRDGYDFGSGWLRRRWGGSWLRCGGRRWGRLGHDGLQLRLRHGSLRGGGLGVVVGHEEEGDGDYEEGGDDGERAVEKERRFFVGRGGGLKCGEEGGGGAVGEVASAAADGDGVGAELFGEGVG